MMFRLSLCFILCQGLLSCGNDKKAVMKAAKENNLIQEKQVNGFAIKLQYMPPVPNGGEDNSLLYFRLNVTSADGTPLKKTDDSRFSYGVDSLFSFVNVTDTLAPLDVTRVANGALGGFEYMLVFERPQVWSQVNCKLLFRDHLFTNQLMQFPLSGNAILHIDSLSLKI